MTGQRSPVDNHGLALVAVLVVMGGALLVATSLVFVTSAEVAGIVRMRDDLSDLDRATIAWPAIHGIVETEAYEQLGGLITTRSWTYRLRLAAGEVDADRAQDEATDGAMAGAIIYEVVLDLSSPRPRIAYLREVTWLRTAAMIAANVDTDTQDTEDAAADPFSGDPAFQEQPGAVEAVPPDETGTDPPVPAAGAGDEAATPAGKRIGRWTAG